MTHVHVYQVVAMAELDINTDDPVAAKAEAIEKVRSHPSLLDKPDCTFLALSFLEPYNE